MPFAFPNCLLEPFASMSKWLKKTFSKRGIEALNWSMLKLWLDAVLSFNNRQSYAFELQVSF